MAADSGTVTGYLVLGLIGLFALLNILSFNKNQSRYILWHFITWVQFFQWTALINSEASADYLTFFSNYSKTMKIYQVITYHYYTEVPTRFAELGVQYTYLINNAEKLLAVMFISLLVFTIMIFATCKAGETLRKAVCDSLIIRAGLICFMEISMFAFLQISKFEITTWYGIMNSVFAVVFITCIFTMIAYLPINSNFRINSGDKDELDKILTVIEEFKYRTEKCRFYYVFFMLQRLVAGLVYVLLPKYCGIQALLISIFISFTSIFHLVAYTYITRPFLNPISNFYVIFLELLSLLSVIFNASFSLSSISTSTKNSLTWCCFALMWTGISVTVIYFNYSICVSENPNINKIIEVPREISNTTLETSMQHPKVIKRGRLDSIETDNEKGEVGFAHGIRKSDDIKKPSLLNNVRNRIFSDDSELGMKAEKLKKTEEDSENGYGGRTQNVTPELNNHHFEHSEEADESFDGNYGNGIKFYGPLAKKYLTRK